MASASSPVRDKTNTREILETELPLEEQIRRRAHEIWLQRGGQDGAATEDWLQAEGEIYTLKETRI